VTSRKKRIEDIALSVAILPLAIPVTSISMGAVLALDGVNPHFTQTRRGAGGKDFTIHKIRTMPGVVDDTPSNGHLDERSSKIGSILRRFRIDEAPQFINVLSGEMSIVGPRPLIGVEYDGMVEMLDIKTRSKWEAARSIAKPGIIDPYSVARYSGFIDPEDLAARAEAEIKYVFEDASLSTDLAVMMGSVNLLHTIKNGVKDA